MTCSIHHRALSISILTAALAAAAQAQTTWYVDCHESPGGSGTMTDPFDTIQGALSHAGVQASDTILVLPGTYQENILFGGNDVLLVSRDGPMVTTIEGVSSDHPTVRFDQIVSRSATVEGFTITDGGGLWRSSYSVGGGVLIGDIQPLTLPADPTIRGNVIRDNLAGYGGGIYVGPDAAPRIENNLIVHNTAEEGSGVYGGGICCDADGRDTLPTEIVNNTITANAGVQGAGICFINSKHATSVTNTIVVANNPAPTADIKDYYSNSNPGITYCDVQGGWTGTGNIDQDPLFVGPAQNLYYLEQAPCQTTKSPCVDTGTGVMIAGTTSSCGGMDTGTVDMGYHYPDALVQGYGYCFGDPGSGTPCPCGNDNNGSVPGSGCGNGVFTSGAQLTVSGVASLASDTLVLICTSAEPDNFGLFFQAEDPVNFGLGVPWGDGLRCAGMGLLRLQLRLADANGNASTTIAIATTANNIAAGDIKRYQYWYRNPMNSPCGSDFNTSNGHAVVWLP